MNDLEAIAVLAQGTLDRANEEYRRGKDTGTVMSVLLIALTAREMLDPAVKYIGLDYSDQGNFLSLYAGLDAEKNDLYPDSVGPWEDFCEEAETSFAWNLDSEDSSRWHPFVEDVPRKDRPGVGRYLLDVDAVIAKIGATL